MILFTGIAICLPCRSGIVPAEVPKSLTWVFSTYTHKSKYTYIYTHIYIYNISVCSPIQRQFYPWTQCKQSSNCSFSNINSSITGQTEIQLRGSHLRHCFFRYNTKSPLCPNNDKSASHLVPLDSWCYTSRVKPINVWTYDLFISILQVEHLLNRFYWMTHTRALVFWNNLQRKGNFAAVSCVSKDRGGEGWLDKTSFLL